MKPEHKAIIERAKLADMPASYIAHELLVYDLVESGLFELKNLHSPYSKLNEGQQQEVIERLTEAAEKAVHNAIAIISSRNVSTIEVTMKEVKFNSKQLTLTSIVDAKDPNRHDLIDSAGRLCLLVMAPDDYNEGLDFIQPERDQREMPLHVSDLTGNLFEQPAQLGTKEELAELVSAGKPSAQDESGTGNPEFAEVGEPLGKEFGDYDYEDAASIVVLHGTVIDVAWLQRRLAVSSDQATTLLLRLVDNDVIAIETEAENSIDNTYTVAGKLDDVVNVE